jgi:hypothetical protein
MGLEFRSPGSDLCPGFSYSGIQAVRLALLKAAKAKLGTDVWDGSVKFSWMLGDDPEATGPVYDVVEGLETNPWWHGKLSEMPAWLPGLLAFVDKSDTGPTWSWGQADEIAEMLLVLNPAGAICGLQLGQIFKHAAINRVPVYGR